MDENHEFVVQLDMLALKKTANNKLFEEIMEVFQCLLSQELKLENEQEISQKYKGKRVLSPW